MLISLLILICSLLFVMCILIMFNNLLLIDAIKETQVTVAEVDKAQKMLSDKWGKVLEVGEQIMEKNKNV